MLLNKNYYDLQGYLATLTTADESQLAGIQAPEQDMVVVTVRLSTWKWVTGPEGLANGGTGFGLE
jgi:hypothetical protein